MKNIAATGGFRLHLYQGVEVVKLIFFNLMNEHFGTGNYNIRQINQLSSTVVNEMFSCHNDSTLMAWATHKPEIEQGITAIKENNPDLLAPFTDALLIHFEIQTAALGHPPFDFEQTLQNAINRGVFDESRCTPGTDEFIYTTDNLVKKYALSA